MYYLYIWQSGNYSKIGISHNPSDRLLNAQCNNPEKMIVLAQIAYESRDKAEYAESLLAAALRQFHHHGEWYSIPSADLVALCCLIEFSLGHAVAVSYPNYKAPTRTTKGKLSVKGALQYIQLHELELETVLQTVLDTNPNATQSERAMALAEKISGDARGYKTVIRAYKSLGKEI